MLNISGLSNGIVLDHIPAGKSMDLYNYMGLEKMDCQVAIIKNCPRFSHWLTPKRRSTDACTAKSATPASTDPPCFYVFIPRVDQIG